MQNQFHYVVTGLVSVLTWLMIVDRSGACTLSESATVRGDPDSGSADRWTEIVLFFGFPQGSVLGPLLFLPYAPQIFDSIASFRMSNRLKLNAEKTQLIWIGTG